MDSIRPLVPETSDAAREHSRAANWYLNGCTIESCECCESPTDGAKLCDTCRVEIEREHQADLDRKNDGQDEGLALAVDEFYARTVGK